MALRWKCTCLIRDADFEHLFAKMMAFSSLPFLSSAEIKTLEHHCYSCIRYTVWYLIHVVIVFDTTERHSSIFWQNEGATLILLFSCFLIHIYIDMKLRCVTTVSQSLKTNLFSNLHLQINATANEARKRQRVCRFS